MDMNEYQALAMRTAKLNRPEADALTEAALGLCGEAGEFADMVKKHRFQRHPIDTQGLEEEIGDCLWYCGLAASAIGVNLGVIARKNIDKLIARYPDGFDPERSIHRGSDEATP